MLSVKYICLISQEINSPISILKTVLKSVLWRGSEYAFFFTFPTFVFFTLPYYKAVLGTAKIVDVNYIHSTRVFIWKSDKIIIWCGECRSCISRSPILVLGTDWIKGWFGVLIFPIIDFHLEGLLGIKLNFIQFFWMDDFNLFQSCPF